MNNAYEQLPHLHCHVRRVSSAEAAVHVAQETVHPSKWRAENCDAFNELRARRAFRERNGIFGAFQRRGFWLVTFAPSILLSSSQWNELKELRA